VANNTQNEKPTTTKGKRVERQVRDEINQIIHPAITPIIKINIYRELLLRPTRSVQTSYERAQFRAQGYPPRIKFACLTFSSQLTTHTGCIKTQCNTYAGHKFKTVSGIWKSNPPSKNSPPTPLFPHTKCKRPPQHNTVSTNTHHINHRLCNAVSLSL